MSGAAANRSTTQNPHDLHWHVCQECCSVWSHRQIGAHPTRAETKEAHTCRCGCGPYYEAFNTYREALEDAQLWLA